MDLGQAKSFKKLGHRYLDAVFKSAGFSPNFRSWITATYSGIHSVIKLNVHFLEPFQTS